jgi:hypothetical protein
LSKISLLITLLTIDHSLIGDTTGSLVTAATGTGNLLDVNPLLGPLANNRGPTQTHGLLPGSPTLDAGDSTETTDQRGEVRPIDLAGVANATDGDGSDMGAYEAQAEPSADFVDNNIIDGFDFLAWQRGFGLTVGAVRSDGNSDDDGDVDASDLAAWEATFGEVETTPLVAAVGSGQADVTMETVAVVEPAPLIETLSSSLQLTSVPSAAELIDAALAWDLANEPSKEDRLLQDQPQKSAEASADIAFANRHFTPTIPTFADADSLSKSSREAEDENAPWISDELLAWVFT